MRSHPTETSAALSARNAGLPAAAAPTAAQLPRRDVPGSLGSGAPGPGLLRDRPGGARGRPACRSRTVIRSQDPYSGFTPRTPSMNCGQRGQLCRELRAYLPVRGSRGRRSSRLGLARTTALNGCHRRTGPAAAVGSLAVFPPLPLRPCGGPRRLRSAPCTWCECAMGRIGGGVTLFRSGCSSSGPARTRRGACECPGGASALAGGVRCRRSAVRRVVVRRRGG